VTAARLAPKHHGGKSARKSVSFDRRKRAPFGNSAGVPVTGARGDRGARLTSVTRQLTNKHQASIRAGGSALTAMHARWAQPT
jgi:hypothetical protein